MRGARAPRGAGEPARGSVGLVSAKRRDMAPRGGRLRPARRAPARHADPPGHGRAASCEQSRGCGDPRGARGAPRGGAAGARPARRRVRIAPAPRGKAHAVPLASALFAGTLPLRRALPLRRRARRRARRARHRAARGRRGRANWERQKVDQPGLPCGARASPAVPGAAGLIRMRARLSIVRRA
jgi:hypothetical protein